jgi:hypothetical protein
LSAATGQALISFNGHFARLREKCSLAQETGAMPDPVGVVETIFFVRNPLRILSCFFRLVCFAYTHVLSFSHLEPYHNLTQEKSYEFKINSSNLAAARKVYCRFG